MLYLNMAVPNNENCYRMILGKQNWINSLIVIIGGSPQAAIAPYDPLRVQKKIHGCNTGRHPPALWPPQVSQLLREPLRLHNL